MLLRTSFWLCLVASLLRPCTSAAAADSPPLKIFVLAGQSNMEGQGVADLTGKDYNGGRGTLAARLQDPTFAARFGHLRDARGAWAVRDDVWVRYQRERQPLLAGPLSVGFAVYGGSHHFGPELQLGHIVGNALAEPVLLIKTAWGGKSLYRDFRPPSSGGETGPYYRLMIREIRTALTNLPTEFPALAGFRPELAGLVWYHGWNDGVDPKVAVPEYETNLVNLIRDFRREFNAPQLPVVIGELTGPWVHAPAEWEALRKAQAHAAVRPELGGHVRFMATRDFVRRAEDSPNPGHGHHEFGNAETYTLVGDALGRGLVSLLQAANEDGPTVRLLAPLERQVFQRRTRTAGIVRIEGTLAGSATEPIVVEAQFSHPGATPAWREIATLAPGSMLFRAELELPAGGWYQARVRARQGPKSGREVRVEQFGVGEIFVVAGQSNSANHGEEKQRPASDRVVALGAGGWQPAADPQPGATGNGGSFLPPFADAIVEKFNVPVGLVAVGVGATSVREWLPRGTRFSQPPTLTGNVKRLDSGEWESKGTLFAALSAPLQQLGPNGFRAVLWHQGESDANQADPARTLPGALYRQFLEKLIRESRRVAGWEVPWFAAQATYHTPADPGSDDLRAAQAAVWQSGLAQAGPDTDALTGGLRDSGGQGVHFSGPGLRVHGAKWAEKVAPWLETQLTRPPATKPRVGGPTPRLNLPGTETFTVAGRPAFVFLPPPNKRATPQPWIFYAPTLPAYPDGAERWMHEQFLNAGVAVAGVDVGEAYGSPASHTAIDALFQELTTRRQFAHRVCLFGRSRGGLWVSSWALARTDRVAGIIGIYPVFDLRTYPGLKTAAPAYGVTPAELESQLADLNPIARIGNLAKAGIPIALIHGDVDKVVPLKPNSGELQRRYEEAGAASLVKLIILPGQGHSFHEGFFLSQELVDFAITHARAGAQK